MSKPLSLITMLATALMTLVLAACGPAATPEQAISENIEILEASIENKQPDELLELIHDNFGTKTGYDKLWVKRTMAFYMLKHKTINIVTSGMEIEVDNDQATAYFTALITGGEGLIPQQGAIYNIETDWRRQNGKWLLIYASWAHK